MKHQRLVKKAALVLPHRNRFVPLIDLANIKSEASFAYETFLFNLKTICMKANFKGNLSRALVILLGLSFLIISCQKNIQQGVSSEASVAGKDPKSLKDFDQVKLAKLLVIQDLFQRRNVRLETMVVRSVTSGLVAPG